MTTLNPTTLQITPTGSRGARASKQTDERVQTLDPTPPEPEGPSAFNAQTAVNGDVIGSAVQPPTKEQQAAQREAEATTKYFRYTGTDRRIRIVEKSAIPGVPANGYTTTIRMGKVFNTKDYDVKSLANQGLIVGRNLEEISAEEAVS